MSDTKLLKNYVSEIDQFIKQYDQTHSGLSKSQQKEKAKYCRIYYLRDVAEREDEKKLPDWF